MGVQIAVQYRNKPVTYHLSMMEDQIFQLRLHAGEENAFGDYLPEKINIRRKGKIWISDMDQYDELIAVLTREILLLHPEYKKEWD